MGRQHVYTYSRETGREIAGYFYPERAKRFEELTEWVHGVELSVHTQKRGEHQTLYYTANGRWVLEGSSDWEGTRSTWEFVPAKTAREWLLRNEDDKVVERLFGDLEEESGPTSGPGRPGIGKPLPVKLPPELRARLERRAAAEGVSLAETVRRVLDQHL